MDQVYKCNICNAYSTDGDVYNVPISSKEIMENHIKKCHPNEYKILKEKRDLLNKKIKEIKIELNKLNPYKLIYDYSTSKSESYWIIEEELLKKHNINKYRWIRYYGEVANEPDGQLKLV